MRKFERSWTRRHQRLEAQWMRSSQRQYLLLLKPSTTSRKYGVKHSLMTRTKLSLEWRKERRQLSYRKSMKRTLNTSRTFKNRSLSGRKALSQWQNKRLSKRSLVSLRDSLEKFPKLKLPRISPRQSNTRILRNSVLRCVSSRAIWEKRSTAHKTH